MKKKLGKIYKYLALFIGVFGGIVTLAMAYLRTTTMILPSDLGNVKMIYFLRYLLPYWFFIFIASALFYATGYIIEILMDLNKNISDLSSTNNEMSWFRPSE